MSETLKKLKRIRNQLEKLWHMTEERNGTFFLPPHKKPDFNSLQEFLVMWKPVSTECNELYDRIKRDLNMLRDDVRFSELTLGFEPLKGYGYKYDAEKGIVSCHRYKYSRVIINEVGLEVNELIRGMEVEA